MNTRRLPHIRVTGTVHGRTSQAFGAPTALGHDLLVGVADQASVVMRSTTIQLATPDALRGRVSADYLVPLVRSRQQVRCQDSQAKTLTNTWR